MDDCSPDQTKEVAKTFADPRIQYIRNEPNLGHLRNYNKGISLAKGKYVWLISADDRLRRNYTLERYVRVLEDNESVGYAFCPGVGLFEDQETRIINTHGPRDWIKNGRAFLAELLNSNSVVAASGLARKACYERVSYFPTDMPWGGDWFLWCAFALHYDVAYLAEPLVNYRTHQLSMTTFYTTKDPGTCTKDDMLLYWRIKRLADEAGAGAVVQRCRHMIGYRYAHNSLTNVPDSAASLLTVTEAESQIKANAEDATDEKLILARLHACLGDREFWKENFETASHSYRLALHYDPYHSRAWIKLLLSRGRHFGLFFRRIITGARNRVSI